MKIAIASGKGGTGKTTLSTNLAVYLSEKYNMVLTDLDVEEPNSGLFLNGNPFNNKVINKMVPQWEKTKCTLCGNCQKVCNFNSILKLGEEIMIFPDLCHGCYACAGLCPSSTLKMVPVRLGELTHYKINGLNFVESRLDVGQEQATPLISQTLDYVDDHFKSAEIILYDSPPGTSCPVIEATKDADYVILVTEPTPFGLHDLKLAVDTMRKLEKEFGIVINRHGIGNDDVLHYCKNENIAVLAKIPNNRSIAELYSRGELVYIKIPAFKQELMKIEDEVIKRIGGLQ